MSLSKQTSIFITCLGQIGYTTGETFLAPGRQTDEAAAPPVPGGDFVPWRDRDACLQTRQIGNMTDHPHAVTTHEQEMLKYASLRLEKHPDVLVQ